MNRYAKIYARKCYTSIETLPVFNWWMVHDTKDLTYLLIDRKKVNRFQYIALRITWNNILEEYIKVFGFADKTQKILELKKKIILLRCELVVNDDPFKINFIRIKEKELEELERPENHDMNFYEVKTYVEKWLGTTINKTCSVREFQTYLNMMEKEQVKAA